MSTYVRVYLSDVILGLGFLVVAEGVLLTAPDGGVARVLAGLAILLFVPGYATVAMLFPGHREPIAERPRPRSIMESGGIDTVERVALSFGVSVALVPLVAGGLYALGFGVSLAPLATALVLLSAVGLVVAALRRRQLPPNERFAPSFSTAVGRSRDAIFDTSPLDAVLNVSLALAVVILAVGFGVALFSPASGTPNTNVMVLTENETGSYVSAGYPQQLSPNEDAELVVGVENNEGEPQDYTVVVLHQRLATDGESTTVEESQEVRRLQGSVSNQETWYETHSVSPAVTGDATRFTYLVYRGEAPEDPSVESAYRYAYLSVSVEDA